MATQVIEPTNDLAGITEPAGAVEETPKDGDAGVIEGEKISEEKPTKSEAEPKVDDAPKKDGKGVFTFTKDELADHVSKVVAKANAKMHKTFEDRDKQRQESIEELRAEDRLRHDTLLTILKENSGIEIAEGSPAAKAIEQYRRTLTEGDTKRKTRVASEQAESSIAAFVGKVEATLTEAGLDPNAKEIDEVLYPLMKSGKYDEVWPAVTRLIRTKGKPVIDPTVETEFEKKLEKKFRKKYGLDQVDLGAGSGAPVLGVEAMAKAQKDYNDGKITFKEYEERTKKIKI